MIEKAAPQKDNSAKKESHQISPPAIHLPKGGGAIRGIGEKFAANPVTGTGSMTVPIATSPGRSGFGPQLSLSYDSGSGNGPFGFGWSLALPAITRKTDKGVPKYEDSDESDVLILSGAEDLVPEFAKDATNQWVIRDGKHVIYDKARTVNGISYNVRRYRPRIEGLFARIERWTNVKQPEETFWRSISKDNITTWYGKTEQSRIADPQAKAHIFTWLICETHDDKGNVMTYEYQQEDSRDLDLSQAHERNRTGKSRAANSYLKKLRYGNRTPYFPVLSSDEPWLTLPSDNEWLFEVILDYDDGHVINETIDAAQQTIIEASVTATKAWTRRQDPFSSYRSGFEVRTYRRCLRVLMFHHISDGPNGEKGYDGLVHSTDFSYTYEPDLIHTKKPVYTFLRAVTQNGYAPRNGTYLRRSLPPVEFEYSQPIVQDNVEEVDANSLDHLPIGLDGASYQWTDLHGEGIPGILTEQADAWFYKPNISPTNVVVRNGVPHTEAKFAPVELVMAKPNAMVTGGRAQFMDLAGDGQPDLVSLDGPVPGLYEHDGEEGWLPFRPFTSRLNRDTSDPNLKFVDVDGDGHADVLMTEHDAFVWHPSLAEDGFGTARRVAQALDEEKGPRLVFADSSQSIYLADLSGDGLTDLVRIRNGEVCYWPNLGYGKFGSKVTMDHAPQFDNPDQFDQKRIRLADIDGSGTTDMIYLHRDGVRLYFNQWGNRWSDPHALPIFPRVDDVVNIVPADLLANGTACLVWSSPLFGDARRQMRYVNLMGGQKPHLLIKTVNNLGAETEVSYAPSTKFYLTDKLAGKPWITRLPFPVHVVERVETWDHISRNRFATRYAYHHGYFDGLEREFRGFGMVEQWDTETMAALTADRKLPDVANIDAASHVPPVHTKTWFHTGVYLDREHISRQFEREYYREPELDDREPELDDDEEFRARLLPDTTLPFGLTLQEEHEACRALKGMMLRQEVYADDASPESSDAMVQRARTPYTVVEQDFTISPLQPRARNRHAVFFAHPREAITYHYERNPADPRIQHALTLQVNEFGNVLKEVAIGYGRRFDAPDAALHPEDREKQKLIHITCTENTVTKPIVDKADVYRTPPPAEARTYEVRKPEQDRSRNELPNLYRFNDMLGYVEQAGDGQHDIDYEDIQFDKAKQAVANDAPEGKKYFRRLLEHVRTLYRDDDLTALLPLRELGSLALPGESYKLAFTPNLWTRVFRRNNQPLLSNPANVLDGKGGDQGGYVEMDGNWWISSGRTFFDPNADIDDPASTAAGELNAARRHFYLPRKVADPFGHSSLVDYDPHDLLVGRTSDAVGNTVTALNDYRVLQPWQMTDPNGNRTQLAFHALGMVVATAVMGKEGENLGDVLEGFDPEPPRTKLQEFIADPHGQAASFIGKATTRVLYDIDRYKRAGQPPFAVTLARETHVHDAGGAQTKIQISFSYSDGFGREIQKKIQAEAGEAPQRQANVPLPSGDIRPGNLVRDAQGKLVQANAPRRWVGTGRTVFNNKGKPVRQYEPFFSATHLYEPEHDMTDTGVSPILFYDPVERLVATLHPNHTYEKVVFDPWRQTTYDVNDTVTFDPKTDPHVSGFFKRLSDAEYLPTWHQQRMGGARGAQEQQAAQKAVAHADTPTPTYLDTLGRPFLTIAHNKVVCPNHPLDGTEQKFSTRVELDIEGNQRSVRDAHTKARDAQGNDVTDELGRVVMRYDYDMLGNRIHQVSMEAGERWMLNDVAGKPIRAWDSRGHQFKTEYDQLRRPARQLVRGNDTNRSDSRTLTQDVVFEKIEYGEGQTDDVVLNLRTRVFKQYDSAGIVTNRGRNPRTNKNEAYDFKGNLLRSSRQLSTDYKALPNWSATVAMEAESFHSHTTYDALNRPIQLVPPRGTELGVKRNIIQPEYNDANLLERVHVWLDHPSEPVGLLDTATTHPSSVGVSDIDYDAKGQRVRIVYKNGVTTHYKYDEETFRLIHLYTRRGASFVKDCDNPQPPPPTTAAPEKPPQGKLCGVQNLHYTYDPAGNITHIRDEAQQTIYFKNKLVEPSADYTYDAIYRLIEAIGREHLGQIAGATNSPSPHSYNDAGRIGMLSADAAGRFAPNDGKAMGRYTERYVYDAAGSFVAMQHRGDDPPHNGWNRTYAYNETSLIEDGTGGTLLKMSNRLSRTAVGSANPIPEPHSYDAHGNMLSMLHLQVMRWDCKDQLQLTQRQKVNDEDADGIARHGERTWYVYDAAGQRVRKVTELANNGGPKEERIYFSGFEIYRQYSGSEAGLVRETLHIMDDKQRIALVETRNDVNDGTAKQLIRYQFDNHLGSVSLELDDQAGFISYEEYFPYGSTSYQAVRSQTEPSKRYRYTAKEREEESGLYYHGARYYAAWLGRWMSCDPAGIIDGPNLYAYCKANPVIGLDTSGLATYRFEDTVKTAPNSVRNKIYPFWADVPIPEGDAAPDTIPLSAGIVAFKAEPDFDSDGSHPVVTDEQLSPPPLVEAGETPSPPVPKKRPVPKPVKPVTKIQFEDVEITGEKKGPTPDEIRGEIHQIEQRIQQLAPELKKATEDAESETIGAFPFVGWAIAGLYDLYRGDFGSAAENVAEEGVQHFGEKAAEGVTKKAFGEVPIIGSVYDAAKMGSALEAAGMKSKEMEELKLRRYKLRDQLGDPDARYVLPSRPKEYLGPGGKTFDKKTGEPIRRIQGR